MTEVDGSTLRESQRQPPTHFWLFHLCVWYEVNKSDDLTGWSRHQLVVRTNENKLPRTEFSGARLAFCPKAMDPCDVHKDLPVIPTVVVLLVVLLHKMHKNVDNHRLDLSNPAGFSSSSTLSITLVLPALTGGAMRAQGCPSNCFIYQGTAQMLAVAVG